MDMPSPIPVTAAAARRPALSVLLALAALACGAPGEPAAPPSDAEAREHLATVVRLVATGDLTEVCRLASGTCPMELENMDPAGVPRLAPVVVGSETVQPTRRTDGSWDAGGLVLRLCGVDGTGAPYESEMLVFRNHDGRLISINTLYWLGAGIARGPTVGAEPPPRACAG
jgi:hypothetical protein